MKKIVGRNYRVEVIPEDRDNLLEIGGYDHKRRIAVCEAIKDQIERHVDHWGYVFVEYDRFKVCEFCQSEWEEDEYGLPLCCEKGQRDFEQAVAKAVEGSEGSELRG